MSFLGRLKVSTRLTLGFGAIALLGIGIATYSAIKMSTLAAHLDEVAHDRMVKVAEFTQLMDNLNANARSVRNMIITDDPAVREEEKSKMAVVRASSGALLTAHSGQCIAALPVVIVPSSFAISLAP